MIANLSSDDYVQVLACIEDLHRCRQLSSFPGEALRACSRLVPNTLAAFNEVNLFRNRLVGVSDRPVENPATHIRSWDGEGVPYQFPPAMSALWEKYVDQHPLVRYVQETGDGQAVKISDFLSARDFQALELYQRFYRLLATKDQMSLTIRSDQGFVIALAFNRERRDFTETERVKLNLVRPHLLQAYANVEELAGHLEEKNDLLTALRETGQGLIALTSAGAVAHATPYALACLARYFPGADESNSLPAPLLNWFRSPPDRPFMMTAGAFKLIVRNPRHSHRPLLLLSEEAGHHPLVSPRLTTRETEVLTWLSEGKTNAEIAIILGVAAGTVKMHVERILAKLGVENRTAATAVAREAGLISSFPNRKSFNR